MSSCPFLPSFIVCLSEERMMNGAIRRNKFPFEPPSRFTPSLQIASFTHSPLTSLRGLHQVHPYKSGSVIKLNKGGWMNLQPRGRGPKEQKILPTYSLNVLNGCPHTRPQPARSLIHSSRPPQSLFSHSGDLRDNRRENG